MGVAWRGVKVLACDPEDMIIADASSTKAGVSVMLELGASSSSLDVYQPPKVSVELKSFKQTMGDGLND